MLVDALRDQTLPPRASALDLCTGSGVLAVSAGLRGAREVTAVDLSRRALWATRLNARLNGVRVRAVRGDLFAPVAGRRFDAIVSNPPYVPGIDPPDRGLARAWEAGDDGRALLDRICAEAPDHLRPGGFVLLVHSELVGIDATLGALRAGGLEADVIVRRRGRLGPLMSARVQSLEQRGILHPGQREEDVVVIRGRAPALGRRPLSKAA